MSILSKGQGAVREEESEAVESGRQPDGAAPAYTYRNAPGSTAAGLKLGGQKSVREGGTLGCMAQALASYHDKNSIARL
ncbi:hypothetical protein AC579_498 [Pseudocercospora musae]|uniref:Uncharacterized protein n=1 Tax=Pseudocercospora musae TaxID=113226 RepID=A0A139INT8_9PEZI|nr:hypothetical protein AC579_498 [Pseudocercospora musae]